MTHCQQCGAAIETGSAVCSNCGCAITEGYVATDGVGQAPQENNAPNARISATAASEPKRTDGGGSNSGPGQRRRTLLKLGGLAVIGGGGLYVLTSSDDSGGEDGQIVPGGENTADDGDAGTGDDVGGDETADGTDGETAEESVEESAEASGLMVVPQFPDAESAALMDLEADEPTLDLAAAKVYEDASAEEISDEVDWASTNEDVLRVTTNGEIQYEGTDGVSVITADHPDFEKAFRIFDLRPAMTAQGEESETAPVDEEIQSEMDEAGLGEWVSEGVSEAWDWTVDTASAAGESIWSGIKYEAEGLRKLDLLVADNLGGHNLSSMGWDHSEDIEETLTGDFVDVLDNAGVKTDTIEENLKSTNFFEEGAKTSAGIVTGDSFGFYVPGNPYPYQYRSPAGQVFWQGYYDTMIFDSSTAGTLKQGKVVDSSGGLTDAAQTAFHESVHQTLVQEDILGRNVHSGQTPGHSMVAGFEQLIDALVEYKRNPGDATLDDLDMIKRHFETLQDRAKKFGGQAQLETLLDTIGLDDTTGTGRPDVVKTVSQSIQAVVSDMYGAQSVGVSIKYRTADAGRPWRQTETKTVESPKTVTITISGLQPNTEYTMRTVYDWNYSSSTSTTKGEEYTVETGSEDHTYCDC